MLQKRMRAFKRVIAIFTGILFHSLLDIYEKGQDIASLY